MVLGRIIPLGSSPLARGLRSTNPPKRERTRIIPARAGFTAFEASADGKGTDHPRSRGVYADVWVHTFGADGSSPLARGLPGSWPPSGRPGRIIPARAGFTGPIISVPKMTGDHPRSRGVYGPTNCAFRRWTGSSPLARGLLPRPSVRDRQRGIIPARAGFTILVPAPGRGHTDHPRSRGVYPAISPHRCSVLGSSPLARGLRP